MFQRAYFPLGILWILLLSVAVVISAEPEDPFNAGVQLYNAGKYREAVSHFDRVLADQPNRVEALVYRARVRSSLKEYDKGLADVEAALKVDPNFALAYYVRGNIHRTKGEIETALEDCATVFRLDPKMAEGPNLRGLIFGAQNKPDLAIAEYTAAIQANPQFAPAYFNRAEVYRKQNIFDKALDDYSSVIAAVPSSTVKARLARGEVYRLQKKFEAADAEYQMLIDLEPQNDRAYFARAEMLEAQQRHEEAEKVYRRLLEIRKQVLGAKHPDYAESLNSVALLFNSRGNYAAAEPLYQEALEIRKEVLGEKHQDYARTLNNLALLYHNQAKYTAAEPLYRQSLEIQLQALGKLHPDYVTSLNNLARLYYSQANFTAAEPLFRQLVEIRKQVLGENHLNYAESVNNLAILYYDQGNYTAAEPLFCQSLAIHKKLLGDRHPSYATGLNNLGVLYNDQANFTAAEPHFRQSLEIRKQVLGVNHIDCAISLNNLANLYTHQANYAAAEPLYRQALEIEKNVLGAQHPSYAASLNNLAFLFNRQANYVEAESLYRQSLEIRKEVLGEKHPLFAQSLKNLALLYREQADYAAAEPLYRQTLELEKQTLGDKHPSYASSLNDLALLYSSQRNYSAAEPLYRQALEIRKQALGDKHPDYAQSLNNLANLYHLQANYMAAESFYREAVDIRKHVLGPTHPFYATSLSDLAHLYYNQANYAAAEPLCRQALDIVQDNLELSSVIQSERQQLAMASSQRLVLDNFLRLAVKYPAAAEQAFRAQLRWKGAIWVRQRENRAVEDRPELKPVFQELQTVTRQLAKLSLSTPDPKNLDRWRQQLEKLTTQKEQREQELSQQNSQWREAKQIVKLEELQHCLPKEAVLIDFLEFWQETAAPAEKPGNSSAARHLLAFIVRPEQPVVLLDLGPVEPLGKAIDEWRASYGRGEKGVLAGQYLREKLWLPVEAKLAGAKTVLISPDGIVGRLPFAALPGKQPGSYLLEEYALATIPVPQAVPALLAERNELAAASTKQLLLLGGVDYDAEASSAADNAAATTKLAVTQATRGADWRAFQALAGTADEIASIEKMYRGVFANDQLTTLAERQASKSRFVHESPQHRYLHVATHGFFAPANLRSVLRPTAEEFAKQQRMQGFSSENNQPRLAGHHPGLLSGLAFAGANKLPSLEQEDGILTAEEVQTLDLRKVDLAVLSACETGLGEVAGGEGLLGLQRAFQVAGAHSTVASLWKVPDAETVVLMERFYNNLWKKKMSKLEALREAQLWMFRQGKQNGLGTNRGLVREIPDDATANSNLLSPYFWAAFVLSGDWR